MKKSILNSKSGMSHIKTAVLVLIFSMVFSIVLTYASMMTIVQTSRDNTIRVLDSFIMHNSKEIYSSLKNGNDFTEDINKIFYKSSLSDEFSLDIYGNSIYCIDEQGKLIYMMSNLDLDYDYSNTLKLNASYTIEIPVKFAGKTIIYFKMPITVRSYYNLKEK